MFTAMMRNLISSMSLITKRDVPMSKQKITINSSLNALLAMENYPDWQVESGACYPKYSV